MTLPLLLPLFLVLGAESGISSVEDKDPWPAVPDVELHWDPRGKAGEVSFEFQAVEADWVETDKSRHAKITHRFDDVAFIVWFEQFAGVDATRTTVAAINGFVDAGPRYFENYAIDVDGKRREEISGKHVILPRGALLRRWSTGYQEAVLREWRYVHENKPLPEWAIEATKKDTNERTAFPFRHISGRPIDIGPYNFFWQNRGLDDSHGGWGIGPFHGGPEDWLACAAGRKNREAEMMLDFQRPIWLLADDFTPLELHRPYWMGRTLKHDPREFRYELDNWCPYAETLAGYSFADYTHLSRGTSGAAAIALWDVFAVECLRAVLTDFKMAQSLTRVVGKDKNGDDILHPGARQDSPLLYPLWKKIETVDGPESSGGDRGLAHWLRLLRWCRPHFPPEEIEPWEEGLRQLVRGLSDRYGITSSNNTPPWVAKKGGGLTKPLVAPFCKTFHQQLVTYECIRFGGLGKIGAASAYFLTPKPPMYFEVRSGGKNQRVSNRNHSADTQQENKMWSYAAYGNMTHHTLNEFNNPKSFLDTMKSRGVNGASQDLDCTPRDLWESAVK
ncbi:MAG: hypothetical protein ACI8X5_000295 [Planctomycetota bacterium]|jgi:hypothetical protein